MDMEVKSAGGMYPVSFVKSISEALHQVTTTYPDAFMVCDVRTKAKGLFLSINEQDKTMDTVMYLVSHMMAENLTRGQALVAIGGGVIQDICTMAAHIYRRGMPLVLVPTTLMAQADSCIGSKCGINVNQIKNKVGCFHPPKRVIVCQEFLDTLPDEHIVSGYGEILKLMLIGGTFDPLLEWVGNHGLRNPGLQQLVHSSLWNKKNYIEADEFEKGNRVILNYGHTFGHALESLLGSIPHGIAVAWGIDVVNYINCRHFKYLPEILYQQVKSFIRQHMPYKVTATANFVTEIMHRVKFDKKVGAKAENIGLVVMDRPGQMHLVSVTMDALKGMLQKYLETENVYA